MEIKKKEEKVSNFFCENCDYNTCRKCDFFKHLSTRKHLDNTLEINGNKKKELSDTLIYECSYCNFNTDFKPNYDKHLLTEKHKKVVYGKEKVKEEKEQQHICNQCNKVYKNYSGLWKHNKICVTKHETTPEINSNIVVLQNSFTPGNVVSNDVFTPHLFMEVLKQSKELQEVLVEQTKELQNKLLEKENQLLEKENQLLEQNKELHNKLLEKDSVLIEQNNKIIELASKQTTNINTQNNQQFNLQFFLNETCKDAMNLVDFVNSLKLTPEDFETTGKLGYVDGISRIFIKELKKLNTEKLPIHCTDLKRETVYIKNNNIWEKENDEKHRLKWTIDRIADLNLNQHHEWQEKYPQCRENNTPENHKFIELTSVALGGRGKEQEDKFREKIMRNVIKEVVIDKKSQMVLV
jgi:hypothetical protein